MNDSQNTLDTIQFAIDDVRRAKPKSAIAKAQMHEALMHLNMAREALLAALASDGTTTRVTIPED